MSSDQPASVAIEVAELHNCARCGEIHHGLIFAPFARYSPIYSHWCLCPTSGQPILMRQQETDPVTAELKQLGVEYDAAVSAGDVPRAGRIIRIIFEKIKTLTPEDIRGAINFFKEIIGAFGGPATQPTALETGFSLDQLTQPGVLDIHEINALFAQAREDEIEGKRDIESDDTLDPEQRAELLAANQSEAKGNLALALELFSLLMKFLRQQRQT
jgi:hypothetical protein